MGAMAARTVKVSELVANVPEQVRPLVAELAENVSFMRRKLAQTRKGIRQQDVVIPYDNGGGQEGIRENPAFKGYHALLASYRKSLEELIVLLERHGGFERTDSESPLAIILAEAERLSDDG